MEADMNETQKDFKMQELHTPSAFEGALWTCLGIKGADTIFHSPPGCYINQHVNALVNDWTCELYSTNLSYANIMQGAEDRMETTLEKIAGKKPGAILIVTAPTVEVTRDDVEGVAKKVGFKDTVIIHPPIGGSLVEGKETAFIRILDLVDPAVKKVPRSVNIIGPTFSTFNWRADVYELTRMLAGIGVTVNCVYTAGATIGQIKNAAQAELNICIYPYDSGVRVAREMEKRFGIPYMADIIPIGFGNSAAWLEQISGFFKIDAGPYLKETMANAFEFISSNMVFTVTFEMTAALSLENANTYAVGISEFLKGELGVDIVMASVSNPAAAERLQKGCGTVMLSPTIEEKAAKFVETAPMAIFGNFYDKKISMDAGFQNFIFADIPTIGYLSTENCPFMGFRGAKYIVQALVNEVYMKIFLETKGEMTGPISTGAVPWDIEAEQALMKVSEMIPHFVRSTAVKKLHQVAEQMAKERSSNVTVSIMQEVADKYTPTKFKAKFSAVFSDAGTPPATGPVDEEDDVPIDSLTFGMPWDQDARGMLEMVPAPFRQAAVTGTEEYAAQQSSSRVTAALMEAFRKELGM
jgi:light-independent protochlorophyllide reductase B subunit